MIKICLIKFIIIRSYFTDNRKVNSNWQNIQKIHHDCNQHNHHQVRKSSLWKEEQI